MPWPRTHLSPHGSEPRVAAAALALAISLAMPSPARAQLAAPCTADADCDQPTLTCLRDDTESPGGGSPPNGLCSVDCSTDGQAACEAFDAGSICRPIESDGDGADGGATAAWCLPACTPGNASSSKCGDRTDLACFPVGAMSDTGYCRPVCGSDADCGDGVCDRRTGLCVSSLPGEDLRAFGARCDPEAPDRQCRGVCRELAEDFSVCTGLCTLGTDGCGHRSGSEASPSAHCLLPAEPTLATGDLGYCLELCDCNADCTHPDAVCALLGPDAVEETGRQGACLPPGMADSDGIPCDEPPAAAPDATGTPLDMAADPDPSPAGCSCRLDGRQTRSRRRAAVWLATALGALAAGRRRARARDVTRQDRSSATGSGRTGT